MWSSVRKFRYILSSVSTRIDNSSKQIFELRKSNQQRYHSLTSFLAKLLCFVVHAKDVELLNVREASSRRPVHLTYFRNIQRMNIFHRLICDNFTHKQSRSDLVVGHKVQHMPPNRSGQMPIVPATPKWRGWSVWFVFVGSIGHLALVVSRRRHDFNQW